MGTIKRVGFSPKQNHSADLFKALGHPARLAILEILTKNQLPCKHVEMELNLSKSTLSRHFQILYDAGILGYNKVVNETYYSINPEAMSSVTDYLLGRILGDQKSNLEDVHFKIPEGVKNPKL